MLCSRQVLWKLRHFTFVALLDVCKLMDQTQLFLTEFQTRVAALIRQNYSMTSAKHDANIGYKSAVPSAKQRKTSDEKTNETFTRERSIFQKIKICLSNMERKTWTKTILDSLQKCIVGAGAKFLVIAFVLRVYQLKRPRACLNTLFFSGKEVVCQNFIGPVQDRKSVLFW